MKEMDQKFDDRIHLTTLLRKVFDIKPRTTVYNDITSKNRRRFKILKYDDLPIEKLKQFNSSLEFLNWKIIEHGTWTTPTEFGDSVSYYIRIEKIIKEEDE